MYYLKDICFLCMKHNRKVKSVLLPDTDGIVFNEKLRCFFPEIIDSTPDEHKLACSECLEKLRISYNFKQLVICNNTVFRDYIDKLQCQHKSNQKQLVVLERSQHRILPLTRDFTATEVINCDDKHVSNSMKIQNENLNLTSIRQEQLNTHDESCQLTKNENDAYFSCQSIKANFKTENVDEEYSLTEEIYIKDEPLVDGFTSNNSDEESKDSEESNSAFSDCENNDQPKQEDRKKGLYKCVECHKEFNASSTLERHRRIHRGEETFQCDVCNEAFYKKILLTIHKRSHDNNQPYTREKPHQCHICQFKCSNSYSLKRHIRTHTGEKPFQCSMCSKSFREKSALTTHMRIHTGEKPYQCLVCSKTFKQNSNLTRHMRIHTESNPSVQYL